jgi:AcrR family transcriptional regulator
MSISDPECIRRRLTVYSLHMPKLWNETIESHRHDVRRAIVEATAELVNEHGLMSVTMSQIAEQSGIGRATLYKYFPDIESILLAWHHQKIAHHLGQLGEIRDKGGGSAWQRLERVLEGFALISFQSRRHRDADLEALLHRDQRVSEAESELSGLIKDLLAEAVSTGGVRTDVGLDELAVYCLHSLAAAGSMPSKAAVHRLVKVTLSGLSQQS